MPEPTTPEAVPTSGHAQGPSEHEDAQSSSREVGGPQEGSLAAQTGDTPEHEAPTVGEAIQAAARGDDPDPRIASLNREAAQRRRQLREAETRVGEVEAERDTLRGQVDQMHRAEVERLAAGSEMHGGAGGLSTPGDIWLVEPDLASFRGEDGTVDAAKVSATLQRIGEERPGWVKSWTLPFDGGASQIPHPAPGPSFGEAAKQARRG